MEWYKLDPVLIHLQNILYVQKTSEYDSCHRKKCYYILVQYLQKDELKISYMDVNMRDADFEELCYALTKNNNK